MESSLSEHAQRLKCQLDASAFDAEGLRARLAKRPKNPTYVPTNPAQAKHQLQVHGHYEVYCNTIGLPMARPPVVDELIGFTEYFIQASSSARKGGVSVTVDEEVDNDEEEDHQRPLTRSYMESTLDAVIRHYTFQDSIGAQHLKGESCKMQLAQAVADLTKAGKLSAKAPERPKTGYYIIEKLLLRHYEKAMHQGVRNMVITLMHGLAVTMIAGTISRKGDATRSYGYDDGKYLKYKDVTIYVLPPAPATTTLSRIRVRVFLQHEKGRKLGSDRDPKESWLRPLVFSDGSETPWACPVATLLIHAIRHRILDLPADIEMNGRLTLADVLEAGERGPEGQRGPAVEALRNGAPYGVQTLRRVEGWRKYDSDRRSG